MISKLAIRRNVTTWMMTMVVFLGGILAYLNLDMELMPRHQPSHGCGNLLPRRDRPF